jgi:hypothetical protein
MAYQQNFEQAENDSSSEISGASIRADLLGDFRSTAKITERNQTSEVLAQFDSSSNKFQIIGADESNGIKDGYDSKLPVNTSAPVDIPTAAQLNKALTKLSDASGQFFDVEYNPHSEKWKIKSLDEELVIRDGALLSVNGKTPSADSTVEVSPNGLTIETSTPSGNKLKLELFHNGAVKRTHAATRPDGDKIQVQDVMTETDQYEYERTEYGNKVLVEQWKRNAPVLKNANSAAYAEHENGIRAEYKDADRTKMAVTADGKQYEFRDNTFFAKKADGSWEKLNAEVTAVGRGYKDYKLSDKVSVTVSSKLGGDKVVDLPDALTAVRINDGSVSHSLEFTNQVNKPWKKTTEIVSKLR